MGVAGVTGPFVYGVVWRVAWVLVGPIIQDTRARGSVPELLLLPPAAPLTPRLLMLIPPPSPLIVLLLLVIVVVVLLMSVYFLREHGEYRRGRVTKLIIAAVEE